MCLLYYIDAVFLRHPAWRRAWGITFIWYWITTLGSFRRPSHSTRRF